MHSNAFYSTVLKLLHCANCNNEFKPQRHWQRYCSAICRTIKFQAQKEQEQQALKAENEQLKAKLAELEGRK
jgi:hypothetical protein